MKKGLIVIAALIFILSIANVFAQSNATEESETDKAYSCLEKKIGEKCSSLSFDEQAFSLLALAYDSDLQSDCKAALESKKSTSGCFPKDSCKLRETSLAVLAYQNIGDDTSDSEDWLLDQKKSATDLNWFLEIDANEQSICTISYSSRDYRVTIAADKKLSGSAGDCLSLAQNSYWLKIAESCLDRNFTVSCDKDFISTLLYKKASSDTYYVSSQTESASASGKTEHKVESYCFQQSNSCNYEGSLWAALALSKTGHDTSNYLPYLIALADDNEKLNPDAFLYSLTGYDEYSSNLGNQQKTEGFWDFSSAYGKFYDTALSVLAIPESVYADSARTWLLDIQPTEGCWQNSIRDTAFILYAAWPKEPARAAPSIDRCLDYGKFCITEGECDEVSGDVLDNYFCPGVSKICCSKNIIQKTCAEKNGIECNEDEQCSVGTVSSSDIDECCLETCEPKPTTTENDCEDSGYNCRSECLSSEEEKSYDCLTESETCCGAKIKKEGSKWWIYLLIILIILVVIGIIFRNKIKIFLYSLKKGGKKGPTSSVQRPPFPPMPPSGQQSYRPMMRPMPQAQRPMQKPVPKSSSDKELEETLKKLKEMKD